MSGYRSTVALPAITRSVRTRISGGPASAAGVDFRGTLARAAHSLGPTASRFSLRYAEPSGPLGIPFGAEIASIARQVGLNPALLAAVVDAESGFNPRAVSSAGAKGLMQLMDGTARGLGVTDPFDPIQNLLGGARFLQSLLNRYGGDLAKALAAYNAGPAAVDRYGGIPPYAETQRYVPKVLAAFQKYQAMLA